jgi:hypothetical protein
VLLAGGIVQAPACTPPQTGCSTRSGRCAAPLPGWRGKASRGCAAGARRGGGEREPLGAREPNHRAPESNFVPPSRARAKPPPSHPVAPAASPQLLHIFDWAEPEPPKLSRNNLTRVMGWSTEASCAATFSSPSRKARRRANKRKRAGCDQ